MSACLTIRWTYTKNPIIQCRGMNTCIRAFNLMLYVELLLKRSNRCFQGRFAPQDVARQCSCTGGIFPIFVHPGMAGNIPLLPSHVFVLGEIRISPLTKRLGNCLSVRFHEHCIPFLFRVMGSLDGFQAQSPHCFSAIK